MSWIKEVRLNPIERFCINVLKMGPIPKHVAFIMDGNRRYAQRLKVEKTEGHSKGFNQLTETLYWCLELGIAEVTVFAFSIENFKRSAEEVESLLQLATEKFEQLLREREKLMSNGVCIRIIGNIELLPIHLKKLIAEAMLMTKENTKAILNIAFAYTSTEEITHTIRCLVASASSNLIKSEDINVPLFSHCMYTNFHHPDMLIRTSGEVRLSDFLLWQVHDSYIHFTEVLWPEFSLWHLLKAVFYYQRFVLCRKVKNESVPNAVKHSEFLTQLDNAKFRTLEQYACAN